VAKKEGTKQLEAEMASLFKAVVSKKQEVAKDVDPKSVLCEHFKAGACKYGKKCKFSHDLEVARKAIKINLYHDPRQMAEDTIDKWDQEKLEEVVAVQEKKRPNETKIVCKYFLDAVETLKYGWRWSCPNGESCIYKHALPEGFVFKKAADKKADEDADKGPTIEEDIELERKKLDLSKCTPVTLERFQAWKEEKKRKKAEEVEAKRKSEAKKTGGKGLHVLSGRDLFIYDPSLFVDDEGAAENDEYETREELGDEKREKIYNSDDEGEEEGEDGGDQRDNEIKEGDGSEEPAAGGDKEKDKEKDKPPKEKTEKEKPKEKKEGEKKEKAKENGEKKETATEGEEKKSEGKKKKKKKKKTGAGGEKAGSTEKTTTASHGQTTKEKPASAPAASDGAGANFVNQELFLADEDLPDEDEL